MSDSNILRVECPECRSILWVEKQTGEIVKREKTAKREKKDFTVLLEKEKKHNEILKDKFEWIKEAEQEKKKELEKIFEKSIKDDPPRD